MRTLASGLLIGLLVIGCGDSSDPSTPTDATGSSTEAGDGTTTADSTPPTGDTGEMDTKTPPEDTTTPPDSGPPPADTTEPPAPDGMNGSPCAVDADCVQDPEHICIFGFCSAVCRDNGEAIPGACDNASAATIFSTSGWGCPSDLRLCMPGPVQDKEAICENSADCATIGSDYHCAGPVPFQGSKVAAGICMPTSDRLESGAACSTGIECQSWFCLGADAATGQQGACADLCTNNNQCPDNNLCTGIGLLTEEGGSTAGVYAGSCIAVAGSLTYCFKQSTCADGEVCTAFIEPTKLGPQYFCTTGNADGLAVGEACTANADCLSSVCALGGIEGGPESGFCTQSCQNDPADCPDTMHCGDLVLHQNTTADDATDDTLFGSCVFGAAGDPCLVSGDWCADDGSVCEAGDTDPEGLGTCGSAPAGCADGGPACDDGLSCTVDTCDETSNSCDYSVLEADTCLIAGMCYGAADAAADNDCQVCDPSTSTSAWSPAAEGSSCDDGDLCTEGDACTAGACAGTDKSATAGSCDDGFDCTTDSCNAADGTCDNTIAAESCLIDGVCHGTGANPDNACMSCDPASATDAWTPVTDGTSCDDGNACSEDTTCTAGACSGGTAVCQLGLGESCSSDAVCESGFCADGVCCNSACDGACDSCSTGTCGSADAGTSCGDGATECSGADTCDGAGNCLANDLADDVTCGAAATECSAQDTCDGAGSCTANDAAAGTSCGDNATECTLQDTCDGAGACTDNGFAMSGASCGDAAEACSGQDTCDGAGACQANHLSNTTECGDAATECSGQDLCDGAGSCAPNHNATGDSCGDTGTECLVQDTCDGAGSCSDNGFVMSGTNCGDAGTECTFQDTCDGAGTCTDNGLYMSGTPCGDAGTECTIQDTCDAAGLCSDNGFVSSGTACGDGPAECTDQDSCDGSGACQPNDLAVGTSCGGSGEICLTSGTCEIPPTWDGAVADIFANNCGSCHTTGSSGGTSLGNGDYAQVSKMAVPPPAYCNGKTVGECAVIRVMNGSMPTFGSVSANDKATLQAWLDGGLLEN